MSTPMRNQLELLALGMMAAGALSACSGGSSSVGGAGTTTLGTTSFEDETEADELLPPRLPISAMVDAPPEPDPSFAGCLSITSRRAGQGLEAAVLLWTYDPALRVLAAVPSDEQGSSIDSADPNQSNARYWKLDEVGRVLIRVEGGSGYRPVRRSVERDEHGNVTAMRAAYVDAIDLQGEIDGQIYSDVSFSNDYNAEGQLIGHRALGEAGVALVSHGYTHDGAGRCEVIQTVGEGEQVERRDYDSAGRLWHRYIEGGAVATGSPRVERGNSVATFQYDELGRLRSIDNTPGAGNLPITEFGILYRSDGSFVVEQNWVSDTTDTFSRTVWSPGCGGFRSLLTPDRNGACAADYVWAGDTAL
jgi:hypothetical protein